LYGRARAIETTAETVDETPRAAVSDDAISVGELEDARLGFLRILSRKFPAGFRERHGDELFAQAAYEFSRKLAQGEEIRHPAAWITRCGLNRAVTERESLEWRPVLVPTESLPTEPVAEESWEPEQIFLCEDRVRKVRDAVERLPAYQQELIARHYFEGESVREAARQLGWSPAKGARAHNAARKKLNSIFDGLSSSDIGIEVGLVSFFSLCAAGRAAAADVPGGFEAALQRVGQAAGEGWHKAVAFVRHPLGGRRPAHLTTITPQPPGRISRLGGRIINSPVAEAAATGSDGPGRLVEVCKVVAVCALSGTGVVTAGIVGGAHDHGSSAATPIRPAPRQIERHRPAGEASPTEVLAPPGSSAVEIGTTDHQEPESPGSTSSSAAHSVSRARAAVPPANEEAQTEEHGGSSSRETFGAFGTRGESGSTEAEPATTVADPLSEEKTQAASPEATEAAAPRQSVEQQAAAEVIHGGFR
jgi:DNA-directed RNA polymerase specialized sigma24 family protein